MTCINTENVKTYRFNLIQQPSNPVELNLCPNCYGRFLDKRNGYEGEIICDSPGLPCHCELPNCH